jgi:hypothetical protein
MIALLCFFLTLFASPFKSKSRLEAENAALRRQLIVLQRRVSGRVQLTNGDRSFLVMLYRWFPSILKAITIGEAMRCRIIPIRHTARRGYAGREQFPLLLQFLTQRGPTGSMTPWRQS